MDSTFHVSMTKTCLQIGKQKLWFGLESDSLHQARFAQGTLHMAVELMMMMM